MQPPVPSARNVRGGVIVRVRGHHPPVSSLLRRDVLVIFVSERVLADEFALTSLEVPARDASAAVLVSRAVLSLSLFARGRRKRARARTTRSRLISLSCVVERAGQKSETFDSRASPRSNSRSSAFEPSSAIASTVSTSRANAQRGRASRAVARPRDTLENLRRLDRPSRRRERASHDERRRTSDVACDRSNARPSDVPRSSSLARTRARRWG